MSVIGDLCPDCGAVFEKGARHTCPHPEVKITRLEAELAELKEKVGAKYWRGIADDNEKLLEQRDAETARREDGERWLKIARDNEAHLRKCWTAATARADALAKALKEACGCAGRDGCDCLSCRVLRDLGDGK